MAKFATAADRDAVEAEMPYLNRDLPQTVYQMLSRTRERFPTRPAMGFQILSAPRSKSVVLNWNELHERVTEAANLFRSLGIGPRDVVAYLLPNALETPIVLLGKEL